MKLTPRELKYQSGMTGVAHTTLNPYGPGVVRIHLIPPKVTADGAPSVVILNGQDILPVNFAWAVLLNEFIKQVNVFASNEVADDQLEEIVQRTIVNVRQVYPKTGAKRLRTDLWDLVNVLCDAAYRREPSIEIGYMSLGEYAPFMKAPHRMDLMVSTMVKNGSWHCNQKCLHCYAAGQSLAETRELSTESWKTILDRCREIGIPQITFTGGEPTMRDDLVELVNHAQWFVTRLNTNGANLTPELCQQLYQASLDSVQITFYSSKENIHNQLVGVNNFQKTLNGIKNAMQAGLSVSINTPLCTLNRDYVLTLEVLYALGIQYVTCSGLIVTGNACRDESRNTQLSSAELLQILTDATNFCAGHHMEISFTSPGWIAKQELQALGLNVPTCGACLSNMAITPDGLVVPCQSWLSADSELGAMLEQPWEKIWNSEKCTAIRTESSCMAGICPLRK